MSNSEVQPSEFLQKVDHCVEENLGDEHFGVSELADAIGMSRSNLLRNIKKETKLSASQYIRQVRLKHGMEMLKKTSLTVSEVSYQVGFNSPSYFVKCFREYYGHPPGEVDKREEAEPLQEPSPKSKKHYVIAFVGVVIGFVILYFFAQPADHKKLEVDKSIAVLPFVNNSNDSSNVYFINGLMESILNNLQKIEDLKVVSRTSVEKYRETGKTMPEIAEELGVTYLIEGSGQKIGDQIMLHVQLIEGSNDDHVWSEEYSREMKDVFALQSEVSKKIASSIQVAISPRVENQIDKVVTDNLKAYDLFLQGLEEFNGFYLGNPESTGNAVPLFKEAIKEDESFAQAHAMIAISYFLMDMFQADKKYSEEINYYSNRALLLDPNSPRSLVSRAFYYMHNVEYKEAEPYLEKAYEIQPNSANIVNTLSDYYANYNPNTGKYLKYALKGVQLDVASQDSMTTSYTYLHLSNALIQSGFVEEALFYIDRSLDYNPDNPFSRYVKAFMMYAKTKDLSITRRMLIQEYQKDSSRLDILQDIGKVYYYSRDFDSAYVYYNHFLYLRKSQNLNMFRHQNGLIGDVLLRVGITERGEALIEDYKEWAKTDKSIYRGLSAAACDIYDGAYEKAIEDMKLFTKEKDYHYWTVLFFRDDPSTENMRDMPEYQKVVDQIESNFWNRHEEIREMLEKERLLVE